jgi:AraC-like DNA-binding protein
MGVPCYSARFIQPFAQVLSTYDTFDVESLNALNAIDPAGRIPIKLANELADQQVALVGDADLGLKAARATPPGRGGALEYAMNSAPTLHDALDVSARFAPLFCDVLRVQVEVGGVRVAVRFDSSEPAPRTIHDYAMALWSANYARAGLGEASRIRCSFGHPKPPNTNEYERSFGPAELRFGGGSYGFEFDREYLDAPLPAADPALHIVLCEHLSLALSQLQDRKGMIDRVRQIAIRELFDGKPTVSGAASALRMSTRTLAGRLEREGTTFSALVDEMRRELALRYLGDPHLSPTEISFRLGFSHVESFYRAFKRWTGETPVVYRRERRGAKPRPQVLR